MIKNITMFKKVVFVLLIGLYLSVNSYAQTYTYVLEEWNFTKGSQVSERGTSESYFGKAANDDASDDQLYWQQPSALGEGSNFTTRENSLAYPVSSGKLYLSFVVSDYDITGTDGWYFELRFLNSSAEIGSLRIEADVRNSEPVIKLRGAGSSTFTTSAGYPFLGATSNTAITVGLTLDFSGGSGGTGSYQYWIGSPDDDGSGWNEGPFGGASGDVDLSSTTIDGLKWASDGSYTSGSYFNLDRILLKHESSAVPVSAGLASATDDNTVTISSNTTTSASARVQSMTVESGRTLTIADGHELTVIDDLTINGSILVQDGGSLKTFGNVTGNITKERTMTHGATQGKYSIVGSPVVGVTTDVLGDITYKYNESTAYSGGTQERFSIVSSAETMISGDAYFTANLGAASFVGSPNTGDINIGMVYSAGEAENAGWNCVSNPYPSAIELKSFVSGNPDITGSIYLWDDGGSNSAQRTNDDYVIVAASGTATMGSGRSADFDGYIRSEQGFIVQATSASTLVFNDVMKAGNNSNSGGGYFRKTDSEKEILRVSLSNEESTTDMVLEVNSQATTDIDRFYDATRIQSGNPIGIFSFAQGQDVELAIQGLPTDGLNTEVWLGINTSTAGQYSLDFDNLITSQSLFLIDHVTGEVIDLNQSSTYAFYSEADRIAAKRFSISTTSTGVLNLGDKIDENLFRGYFANDELIVLSRDGLSNAAIAIHDIQGRLVGHSEGINSQNREWSMPLATNNGVFIVTIYNLGTKESFKILK